MRNTGTRNRRKDSAVILTVSSLNQAARGDSQSASHEAIEKHAYGIYQKNGCQEGRSVKDWHQAERELDEGPLGEDRGSSRMVDEGAPIPGVRSANPD